MNNMKNLRKIILLFTLVSMLITNTAFAQKPSAAQSGMVVLSEGINRYESMETLLVKLGITEGAIPTDKIITRAEAAAFALKMGGNTFVVTVAENYFKDVSSEHQYAAPINALAAAGVVSGFDGYFYPDKAITAMEFASMLMRVGGFGPLADMNGGYPNGYIKFSGDIFDNVKAIYENITYSDAVTLMYNILFEIVPVVDSVTSSENSAVSYSRSELFIEEFFGMEKFDGTLVADKYAALNGRTRTSDSTVIIKETSSGTDCLYTSSPDEIHDYIGCRMEYFTDEKDEAVIWFIPKNITSSVYVENRDIEDVNTQITKVTYLNDSGKIDSLSIKFGADFIYNGTSSFDVSASDMKTRDGYTEFLDSDNDNVYDVVKIWNFDNYFVGRTSVSSSRISDINTGASVELDAESSDYDLIIKKYGKTVEFGMIEQYDTVSVAKSNTDTGDMLVTAIVADTTVEATVSALEDECVYLNNELYDIAPDFDIARVDLNTKGMFAVNFMGEISGVYYQNINGVEYGYLINAGKKGTLNQKAQIRILAQDSQFVILDMSEKFRINNVKSDADDLITTLSSGDEIRQTLIAYVLDDDGKVKDIYIPSISPEGFVEQGSKYRLIYNRQFNDDIKFHLTYGVLDGEYHMKSSVPLFRIVRDADGNVAEEYSRLVTYSGIAGDHGYKFNFGVYDADNERIPGAAVLEISTSELTSNKKYNLHPMIVESVTEIRGNDGEMHDVVKGYENGKEKYYYYDPAYISLSSLRRGDAIALINEDTELVGYETVFKMNCGSFNNKIMYADYNYTEQVPGYYDTEDGYGHSSGRSLVIGRVSQVSENGITIIPEGTDESRRYIFSGGVAVYTLEGAKPYITVQSLDYVVPDSDKAMVYTRYGVAYAIIIIK